MCNCPDFQLALAKLREQLFVLGVEPLEDGSIRVIQGKYSRWYEGERAAEYRRMRERIKELEKRLEEG